MTGADLTDRDELLDALTDAIADLPRGEWAMFGPVEVSRQERPDPDEWEFMVNGSIAAYDRHEAARHALDLGARVDD
jgi:hypothetical protein